jgi:hypothetical protein
VIYSNFLLSKVRALFAGASFLLAISIYISTGHAQQAEEKSWPRQIDTEVGTIVVYQPQLDGLEDVILSARAAFSIEKTGKSEPEFGAMFLTARVEVDRETRQADIDSVKIERLVLEGTEEDEIALISAAIEKSVSDFALSMSYDRLIAALEKGDEDSDTASGLKNDAPRIIVKNVPAVLVSIDGKAKLLAIKSSEMLYVENSPFPIILDPQTKSYFLNGGKIWYKSSTVEGPWTHTEDVPDHVAKTLQLSEEQMKALEENVGGASSQDKIPEIITAFEPTELIVIDGETEYTPLVGADLLYVGNSETPIFKLVGSKDIYVLLSGRWYKSTTMVDGKWTNVQSDQLPEVFAKIPEDSDRGEILSHIAGTEQAREAVINATIPQVTAIKRDGVEFDPQYKGEPEFAAIKGTEVEYAINTSSTVLRIDGKYYAVDEGVWFVADSAKGPWSVAEEVPAEVESIPASSPVYNVRYVRIYDSTPQYVYVGYTPGYLGSYIYNGVVVYGTGYYYPWLFPRYYYPRPITWGFGAYYRPWLGWGYGIGWGAFRYRPGFRAGVAIGIGIGIGHSRWFGPGGYNPYRRSARRATYRTRNNIYNRPQNRARNQFKNTRPARRSNQVTINNRKNNVFTDKSGNVLRKTDKGWQSRDNGKWKNTKLDTNPKQRPSTRPATRPNAPSAKPAQPKKPVARPKTPKAKPANRAARPAKTQRSKPKAKRRSTSQSRNLTRQSHSRSRGRSNQSRSRQSRGGSRSRSRGGGGGRRR